MEIAESMSEEICSKFSWYFLKLYTNEEYEKIHEVLFKYFFMRTGNWWLVLKLLIAGMLI